MVASSCSPLFVRMLACAAFALAFIPASARAAGDLPVPAAAPLMTTAHGYAVARWGMEPCGGQVAVSWTHMGSGINARSQWMSIDAHDPTTYSDCSVSYNLDVGWDWPKLCTVVEHELGHLPGHDHVNDPHDVMSPYYIYPAPECAPATTQAPPATADAAPRRAASVTPARHATSKKAAAFIAAFHGLSSCSAQRGWEALKAIGWSIQVPRPKNPQGATEEERQAFKKTQRYP